jgi:hypothetical protein
MSTMKTPEAIAAKLQQILQDDECSDMWETRHNALIAALESYLADPADIDSTQAMDELAEKADLLNGKLPTLSQLEKDPELVADVREWAKMADDYFDGFQNRSKPVSIRMIGEVLSRSDA